MGKVKKPRDLVAGPRGWPIGRCWSTGLHRAIEFQYSTTYNGAHMAPPKVSVKEASDWLTRAIEWMESDG